MTDGLVEARRAGLRPRRQIPLLPGLDRRRPVKNWFDQSFTDMQPTASVYLVTLAKATANPLLKESDEESHVENPDS